LVPLSVNWGKNGCIRELLERLNNTNKSVLLMKKMSAIYLYFPSSILVVSLMLMQLLTTQAKNSELSHDVLVVILSLECSMHLSSIP